MKILTYENAKIAVFGTTLAALFLGAVLHKPTEFLRTPMSLNDTMHLMRNVFCDYIEHHKSIYMEPRDLEKLRRIKK